MKRTSCFVAAGLSAGLTLQAGAAGAQVGSQIGQGVHRSGRAGLDTLGQTYNGMGSIAASPFRDFGVMRSQLPPPLEKARVRPYDVRGLNSCDAVLNEVAELDLVLGPDIDTPDIEKHRNQYNRAADFAGSAAVDAMRSAVNHFIPMRDTIRKLTGAERAQKKMEKAMLAGKVRRGFLKSYGMQHNCAWPAAPAAFTPLPGGPVWTLAIAPVTPPPAPMTPAVIAAETPIFAGSSPLRVASAAPARVLAPAIDPGPAPATELQAGAWRIGPASAALASVSGARAFAHN